MRGRVDVVQVARPDRDVDVETIGETHIWVVDNECVIRGSAGDLECLAYLCRRRSAEVRAERCYHVPAVEELLRQQVAEPHRGLNA